MTTKKIKIADLFCGAGGTSTGAIEAAKALGYAPELTAINHWPLAIETHTANHPDSRHLCASLDSVNPRDLYNEGELDLLLASPECMGHSVARGGRPINDQSRATAWCVLRWADALLPTSILIENVPEFESWAPIGSNGRPLPSRRGEVFQSWLESLRSLGYRVDHRVILCANNGDPTTRRRLFIQAVRGRRKIVWPDATHTGDNAPTFFGQLKPWVPAREIIRWDIKGTPISKRKKPLSAKTMERIREGWEKFGLKPFIVPNFGEHIGQPPRTHPIDDPLPTVTQRGAGNLVEPFLIEYYGEGGAASVEKPLSTVTTKDRFGLVLPVIEVQGKRFVVDFLFRMLRPDELAGAQGFRRGYKFCGNKTDTVKQIGNAVPRRTARALVAAMLSQNPDVSEVYEQSERLAA